MGSKMDSWDPDSEGPAASPPSKASLKRMQIDLSMIHTQPLPGVVVFPTDNAKHVWALLSGPEGTPYESAPFLLKVVFPNDYPLVPPKVRWVTTGGGAVRFGPNLYACGKVCLSILGTWSGPSWLPSQNLSTMLLSIQSLMGVDAARNEPGREDASEAEVKALNDVLSHETLRVAVLEQTRAALAALAAARGGAGGGAAPSAAAPLSVVPPEVHEAVVDSFRDLWENHAQRAREFAAKLDGQPFAEPSVSLVVGGSHPRKFHFAALAADIEKLAKDLPPREEEGGEDPSGMAGGRGSGGGGGGGGGKS
jgi:ubiquitin-conjugating enzyme E2 Z